MILQTVKHAIFFSVFDEFFQLAPTDTFGIVSEDVLLECSPPLSLPLAIVYWSKNSILVEGDRFNVLSNGSLSITEVEFSDEGQFICMANNTFLDITRSADAIQLSVYGKIHNA